MARANLIDVGRPSRDHFWRSGASTRSPRWAACCGRPRSASGAAQPSSRRLPRKARFLPLGHGDYVGMPEGEVNATGAAKSGAADINYFEDNPRPLRSA